MKTILLAILGMFVYSSTLYSQQAALPLKEWPADGTAPLVLFISGDGGLNNFSTALCNGLHNAGYSVAALNAQAYFNDKKTPEQATADITRYLTTQLARRKNQQLVLIGYSFGADVLPFIVNRLPGELGRKCSLAVLLSPSTSTDFETHWSDMLGINRKRSMDVLAEINKMTVKQVVTFFGESEKDFPVQSITLHNYRNGFLPGGHHYDGDPAPLIKLLNQYLQ